MKNEPVRHLLFRSPAWIRLLTFAASCFLQLLWTVKVLPAQDAIEASRIYVSQSGSKVSAVVAKNRLKLGDRLQKQLEGKLRHIYFCDVSSQILGVDAVLFSENTCLSATSGELVRHLLAEMAGSNVSKLNIQIHSHDAVLGPTEDHMDPLNSSSDVSDILRLKLIIDLKPLPDGQRKQP